MAIPELQAAGQNPGCAAQKKGRPWRHPAPERERTSQKAHLLPTCGGTSGRSVAVLSREKEEECQGRLGIRVCQG